MSVVDCHMHWFPKSYYDFLSQRSAFPKTTRNSDGSWTYRKEGRSDTLPATWFDLDDQFEAMAATGREIVMISSLGIHSDLDGLPAAEAAEAARSINEELDVAQRRHAGRFYGVAAVPLQDTNLAIDELDYAITKLDLRGVSIPGSIDGEPLDVPRLEPFYTRVAELGVPLVIHPTDGVFLDAMRDEYDDALYYSLGRMVDSSAAVLRLVLGGLLDRQPNLKILHCHAGGVLPYLAGRLDKNAAVSHLNDPPSAYVKRMYVDTVAPNPMNIRWAVEYYGPDRVLYGSDNPCWNPAAALRAVEEAGFDSATLATILESNVRQVFDLRAPSLRMPDLAAI